MRCEQVFSEMSRMWRKNVTNGKEYLMFDREWAQNTETQTHEESHSTSRSCRFWFFCRTDYHDWVRDTVTRDAQAGKTLQEQMNTINTHDESDVQWQWEGEKVIPKALKVLNFFYIKCVPRLCLRIISSSKIYSNFILLMTIIFEHYEYFLL